MSNLIVNSLWIGNTLSKLELLTIKSFIAKGHQFQLWVYEPLDLEKIEGLHIKNANEILDHQYIFSYSKSNTYGHGKGSYAGFSDIFRYKLLYEIGGWWVDMDIYCLKAFDFNTDYFFRSHHELLLVGNVMKCPPKSALMLQCYQESLISVNAENTDWHLPIQILINQVKALGLEKYIQENISNFDKWEETNKFIFRNKKIPKEWYFIHWQNEEWRNRSINKNNPRILSCLGRAMKEHHLIKQRNSILELILNYTQSMRSW